MQQIKLTYHAIDDKKFEKKTCTGRTERTYINKPSVLTYADKPVMVYGQFPNSPQLEHLRSLLKSLEFGTSTRTAGLVSTSRTFGFMPRVTIRRDFCTATAMSKDHPLAFDELMRFGEVIAQKYQEFFPETFAKQTKIVNDSILQDWIIPKTPFTSGIANKNNALKYHYDNGNFDEVASCMLVLKKNSQGGNLCIPMFDLQIDICDRGFVIFDGQSILHGVSPINNVNSQAYRYSVVYYALKAMTYCLTPTEELARIRTVKRIREKKRLHSNG